MGDLVTESRTTGKPPRRLSITLSEEQHNFIERYAADNETSSAWVVRRAVSDFLERVSSRQAELPLK